MPESFTTEGIYGEFAEVPGGSGRPTLLLIHGGFLGAWCWEHWLRELPGLGWSAAALSARNHPGSFAVDNETYRTRTTLADYLADVTAAARYMETRTGQRCIPVGHSMGGILAQCFAAQETQRGEPVPAMVLLCGVPPAPLGPLRKRPAGTHAAFLPVRTPTWPGNDPVLNAVFPRMVAESPNVMNAYSLGAGVPVERDAIRCRTLVVSAERDNTIVPKDDRIARHYAAGPGGADYWLAEGMGHLVMLEPGWERVLRQVVDWLNRTAR
ncbi:MAG TPA: alpha/beta fold hydrolase [bacterium]